MTETHYFTLGQAAKEANVSKSKISKDLNSGKLSYVGKTKAGYKIDPAELFRVYPQKTPVNSNKERLETPKNTNENSLLKKEIEMLREQLKREQTQSDHWREQAERVSHLLTDQRPKGSGWFDRLLGRA